MARASLNRVLLHRRGEKVPEGRMRGGFASPPHTAFPTRNQPSESATVDPDPITIHQQLARERKRHAPLPQSCGVHRPHRSAGEMHLEEREPGVGTYRANPRLWETSPADLVGSHPGVMKNAEHGAMKQTTIEHTSFRPGLHTAGFCTDEAIPSPFCIQSSNTSPSARKPGSCPSPPKGGEGARRADEGGIRVPTTNRVPHQKPTVREREC